MRKRIAREAMETAGVAKVVSALAAAALIVAMLGWAPAAAAAGFILTPQSVTFDDSGFGDWPAGSVTQAYNVSNWTNGNGLSSSLLGTPTTVIPIPASWPTADLSNQGYFWDNSGRPMPFDPAPTLTFTLGQAPYNEIYGFHYWNANEINSYWASQRGVKNMSVWYSTDSGANYTQIGSAADAVMATGLDTYTGTDWLFGTTLPSNVTHIRFTINSSGGDATRAGFAEVRLLTLPEPSSLALLALGGLALLKRQRKP